MKNVSLLVFGVFLTMTPAAFAQNETTVARYFPAPLTKETVPGSGIQRTMHLLATSTPQHRNKVRILFYGQSITEQNWWKIIADDLRTRFPNADLEIENRAIGGFAAQSLIRPAEHDLYPFYPDLLIFHVYGDHTKYEEIIRNVRTRTTAEILMQKDHVTQWPLPEYDENKDKGAWWDNLMNTTFLPNIAQKYDTTLLDIRTAWLNYLKTNHLEPKALLSDNVHLNEHGCYLMAEFIKKYLVYNPKLPVKASDWVKTYTVGKDITEKNGKWEMPFTGNRVDLIFADGATETVRVMVDGKRPSEFNETFSIPRPEPRPWSPLALVRVDHEKPLLEEEWTLKVTSVNSDSTEWAYTVSGSKTGADGEGNNKAKFVSPSGRVVITPEAFFRNGNIPVGHMIRWKVVPLAKDSVSPAVVPGQENSVTVIQGIANAPHTLTLTRDGKGRFPVRAVRVFAPPLR